MAACKGGHTETALLLIDEGADVNQCDEVSVSYLVRKQIRIVVLEFNLLLASKQRCKVSTVIVT